MPQLMRMCTTQRTIKGFTIVEMIIVMVIVGIIASSAALLLSASFTSYFTGINIVGLSAEASMAMARMSKELQQAVSFSAINPTNVSFRTTGGSTISYSWTTPTITRTGSTAQSLNKSVTSFALTYYKSDFTNSSPATTVTTVRAITINMTLSNGTETVPIINTIYLSNMR